MYTKNEYYWTVPTVENCYYAGFIAADGCIVCMNDKYYRLQVVVEESDRCVLDNLKDCLQYTGPLIHRPATQPMGPHGKIIFGKPQIALYINTKQYHIDLEKHFNIVSRKSLILTPPNITNIDMIKAYISGYIDGDGMIGIHGTYKHKRIKVLGTESLLTWIKEFLALPNKVCQKGNIFVLELAGKSADTALSYLSTVNVPRLERKWKYACSI